MNWQLVTLSRVPASPWRNGGGSTRELLAWPGPADWRVRMSVADVESDGPFSAFPGIERWFCVLEGEGVTLRTGAEAHTLREGSDPFRFDGAAAVDCTLLAGATRDFNLMAAPGRARQRRIAGAQRVQAAPGTLVGLYAHRTGARITADAQWLGVPAGTLAWCPVPSAVELQVDADAALWMEVVL
ncbi:HutD family protein [Ramlibacter terrae]|uniref:HutD family protein n=1 Tax=Ramlibacter terrae TaxID=2732511 RepID=A0ABX6P8Q2_9BURK|nr:HutD family protein [Ramlibacter terrae]